MGLYLKTNIIGIGDFQKRQNIFVYCNQNSKDVLS